MTPATKAKKDALLAEVIGAGAGQGTQSAMGSERQANVAPKKVGRPPKAPTVPFTLRLGQQSAELLTRLVQDLQARAMRGEMPRSEATIGRVVQEALDLYAAKLQRKPS